jgi:hypothetical protein
VPTSEERKTEREEDVHGACNTSLNTLRKRPHINFMESLIGEVRTFDLGHQILTTEMFLFVCDIMLRTSNDTRILDTLHGLCRTDAREERIGTKTLPIPTTGCDTTHVHHGTEGYVDTFTTELLAHGEAALINEVFVPRGRDIDGGGAAKKIAKVSIMISTEAKK